MSSELPEPFDTNDPWNLRPLTEAEIRATDGEKALRKNKVAEMNLPTRDQLVRLLDFVGRYVLPRYFLDELNDEQLMTSRTRVPLSPSITTGRKSRFRSKSWSGDERLIERHSPSGLRR